MGWLDHLTRAKPKPAADAMADALQAANAGDYSRALSIWEPLAREGVARAQNNIGACFAEGLGIPRNREMALKWLTLAATAGDPVGQRNYAAFHMQGVTGSDPDYALAAQYYQKAAEQGDPTAQDMLSWMLIEGEVIATDYVEARRLAELAAAQGNAASMTRLGMILHNALGVERDAKAAADWWRKAATRGDADGQAMLGAAYHLGSGVARDPVEAFAWLTRARNGGSPLAGQFFEAVRQALSREEIADAERRAAAPLEPAS